MIERLWKSAPADITGKNALFIRCCGPLLLLEALKRLNGRDVIPELGFWAASADAILIEDTVVASDYSSVFTWFEARISWSARPSECPSASVRIFVSNVC